MINLALGQHSTELPYSPSYQQSYSPHTVPSAPKSEGGSSWYKSMFRSMLANDDNDEGTYYMLPIGSHDLCRT